MSDLISWEEGVFQQMEYALEGYELETVKALQKAKEPRIYLQDVLGRFPINMPVKDRIDALRAVNGKLCKIKTYKNKNKTSVQVEILIDRIQKDQLEPIHGPNHWNAVMGPVMNSNQKVLKFYQNSANQRIKPVMGKTFNRKHIPTDVLDKQGQVLMVLDRDFLNDNKKALLTKKVKLRKGDKVVIPTDQVREFLNKKFSFMWRYDKRGRMYSHGYQINIQGDKLRKGMINFANAEKLTANGVKWVYRYIADLAGYGGTTFKEREVIGKSIYNKEDEYKILKKNPILKKVLSKEVKVGAPWNVPIELDAVNSGLQVLGLATSCESTLKHTCVIGNKRNDAYKFVANKIDSRLDREEVKYPLMTH